MHFRVKLRGEIQVHRSLKPSSEQLLRVCTGTMKVSQFRKETRWLRQ